MNNYIMGICSNFILFIGLFTLGIATPAFDRTTKCVPYKSESGISCYPCQEGFYKIGDCTEDGHQADCKRCPNGTYQTYHCSVAETCARCNKDCSHLSDFMEVEEQCTFISDIKCRCKLGYYWMKSRYGDDKEGMCLPHKSCKPGEGVESSGTRTENVKCQTCVEGTTYSNTSSPNQTCTLCTRCGDIGLDTVQKCNLTHDSICALIERKEGASAINIPVVVIPVLFVIALPVTVGVFMRCCYKTVWYKWKAKLLNRNFPKGNISWNKFFKELTEKIPWDKFKILFRELMWEISQRKTSKLTEAEIETKIKQALVNHNRDVQESQYQLLLEWRSTCEKNGVEPIIEHIECAFEKAQIDIRILQDVLSIPGVVKVQDETDVEVDGEEGSLLNSLSESITSSGSTLESEI